MAVLIINGSPRKDGNTAFFINRIREKIPCDVIDAYYADFRACDDCRSCVNGACVHNDDAARLFENIESYDTVIMASPLYFNQPTGMLMALMSRTQIFFNGKKRLREKTGYIILTGGGDTVINSADAEKTMRIMLMGLNVKVKGYVRSLRTSYIPAERDNEAIKQLERIIEYIKNDRA